MGCCQGPQGIGTVKRSGWAALVERWLNNQTRDTNKDPDGRSETDGKSPDSSDKTDMLPEREQCMSNTMQVKPTKKGTKTELWLVLGLIAALSAVLHLAYAEIRWKGCKVIANDDSYCMTFFPMRWLILTNAIQVMMWWVGICLAVM